MSDTEKVIFKAKLELETITPEEIQKWAIEALEKDSSNELALDICFLPTSEQVQTYFKQISNKITHTNLARNEIYQLLKKHMIKNTEGTISEEKIYSSFQKILGLAKYIEDEELYDITNSYVDEFYFSNEGYSELNPNEVLLKFINELTRLSLKSYRT